MVKAMELIGGIKEVFYPAYLDGNELFGCMDEDNCLIKCNDCGSKGKDCPLTQKEAP